MGWTISSSVMDLKFIRVFPLAYGIILLYINPYTNCKRLVMNRTPLARRTQIINCLVEGNSIRSTERMTDTHRDTIMRLMVEVGTGCAALANDQMRNLDCRRIQCDEIWSFCRR